MGCDVAANSPAARGIFDRAAAVLGYDLLELQREGPEEKLRETEYSQPAIFTTNVALYEAVRRRVRAGRYRGPFVRRALQPGRGALARVRRGAAHRERARQGDAGCGATSRAAACRRFSVWRPHQVRDVLEQLRSANVGRVSMANFNSPTQIVISGDLDAVQAATANRCWPPAPSASCRSTYRVPGTAC